MGTGRQQIRKPRVKKVSTRKNWSKSIRLKDNTLLMYGRRGACYFMLHSEGFGQGFAHEADLDKAILNFQISRLGES